MSDTIHRGVEMDIERRRILTLGAALALSPLSARARVRPVVGQTAPDFHAVTFQGQKVALADFKNEVLVLNFWATWCGPCRKELPLLDAYYRAQQRFGLKVLGVTLQEQIPVGDLAPLAKMVSFAMARHFSGPYGDGAEVPSNYVIDRAGVLRYAEAGAFTLPLLNSLLVPLLNEPPPDEGRAPVAT
ncbi:MAG TPA: TlpA disulfide reductase family protein [Caulobacteraceae bacterium]